MAKSKYEYVKFFEKEDTLLKNTWAVVRIDGRGFHKFTAAHCFEKPNDPRGLSLMNRAAQEVMLQIHDIIIGYGESDEFSFVISKKSTLYNRRESKICSTIVSIFTANYVFYWNEYMPDVPLQYPPCFDGRIVLYPSDENLRDYLSWRQADCHINNLYNTCFWTIVQSGVTETEAEAKLRGTVSAQKNEMLFTEYGINYSNLPAMYRRGSVLIRDKIEVKSINTSGKEVTRQKSTILIIHDDIIGSKFWKERKHLLSS
ncbi:tRNA-histidine guanylyltransferase 1-like [Basidiobolus ranarum]|uniref:tRNA(His) guanylyltransferase n=1 Tax=Basidiobolus ranarum TaxID=34480 RepID=A0ABR2W9X3_9FUNG